MSKNSDVKPFDLDDHGLAEVLKDNWLKVPPNQREYRWDADNVKEMLQDLSEAIRNPDRSFYFMGSIVLTKRGAGEWSVTDGQQRLATTTIILCAIRDIVLKADQEVRASGIESECICTINPDTSIQEPKLRLNSADHDFFYKRIILRPKDRQPMEKKFLSHRRLEAAYTITMEKFASFENNYGKGFVDALMGWRRYLLDSARVLVLKVPDSKNAFVMFETLNDRGVKTSEVDVVKNHIFKEADNREDEAQASWTAMRGVIESLAEEDREDDLVLDYVKCACCVMFGNTREKQIFERISEKSIGPLNAVTMAAHLESMATDYAAISNAEHPKWNKYPSDVRNSLRMLFELRVKQMRPLILSVAKNFSDKEVAKTLKGLVSWSVRLTVAGGSRAGRLDDFYAGLANRVNKPSSEPDKIGNYAELLAAAGNKVPGDAEFQSAFETIKVRVEKTARYYLRELERVARNIPEPALVPNSNEQEINLEHVMPSTPTNEWPHISLQDIETHADRLGNLALIQVSKNCLIDRDPFSKKKPILSGCSDILLTEMIGTNFDFWGTAEIETRQKHLAGYAAKAWPLNP